MCPVEVALGEFMDAFVRASKVMRAAQETAMRRHGLHLGQNLVLAALWERDGRTPGDIAATLNVTTPTIVKMATRMANAGLLTRRRDHPDNRLVLLYLTESGRAVRGAVEDELERLEARVTDGLTEQEVAALTSALRIVGDNTLGLLGGSVAEPD
jgi:DNA-binding MarR family transcriptional regulator